jgi:hypothetical protein
MGVAAFVPGLTEAERQSFERRCFDAARRGRDGNRAARP